MLAGCGKHEHTWAEATCTTPKTCSECEETEGEPLGHSWVDATCTSPKTCSRCDATEGEPLGHQLSEANYQQPATCSVCGATEGEPLQADFDKYGLVCNAELNVPRAFVIYPSNREAYYALKSVSPELAVKYLEVLLDYGVLRKPIPPNPLLEALLVGTTQTIEKSYREYRKKVEQTEREERKKFMDEYFKKKGMKR